MYKPNEMTSLTAVLEKLRLKKMDNEFKWTEGGFTAGKGKVYQPEDLKIIKVFRFEGDSDPGDENVIYIIEANDGLVGYSMDAYGMYTSQENELEYNNFMRKIPVEDRDEQLIFEV
jgi:hypothetical protein